MQDMPILCSLNYVYGFIESENLTTPSFLYEILIYAILCVKVYWIVKIPKSMKHTSKLCYGIKDYIFF